MATLQPKFRFAFPCDDIRQETNGKYILIGVYTEAFVPEHLPMTARLALALFVDIAEAGPHVIDLELRLEGASQPAATMKFEFEAAASTRQALIPIPSVPLLIGQPGDLTVHYGPDKMEVMRLTITPPNASALQPPSERSPPAAPA